MVRGANQTGREYAQWWIRFCRDTSSIIPPHCTSDEAVRVEGVVDGGLILLVVVTASVLVDMSWEGGGIPVRADGVSQE